MPAPDTTGSFWKTIPGMLTAAAGFITAATGLVVAINQTGVFKPRTPAGTDATPAATEGKSTAIEPAAVSGAWRAMVTYSWGATHAERFAFQVDNGQLSGTVTYLGTPRGIQSAVVEGNQIRFTVRAEEFLGTELRAYQLTYRGTVAGGGILFVLDDSRGTPSVQFAAARDLPSP
jgi:hypothetical protein